MFFSRPLKILTVFLLMQCLAFYALANRTESTPIVSPLSSFPQKIGDWSVAREGVIEKEIMDVLRADDAITRWYTNDKTGRPLDLFIAYFNTQKTGKAPHSPKNCLPGAGWMWILNDQINIPIAGQAPVEANRYVVGKGNEKSVVLYWYQSVLDSIRYNRSDTAIVKVTLPLKDENFDDATAVGMSFVQSFFDKLLPYFPR
jgi:hypothetical protein